MNTQTIGIRHLLHNIKQVSQEVSLGKMFIVLKNAKPIFKISPIADTDSSKKYTLADFKKIQFSGDKDLSENIDSLIYN